VRATGAFVAALTLATGTAKASAAATANAARGFSRCMLNSTSLVPDGPGLPPVITPARCRPTRPRR
jgi:hypothetical protein